MIARHYCTIVSDRSQESDWSIDASRDLYHQPMIAIDVSPLIIRITKVRRPAESNVHRENECEARCNLSRGSKSQREKRRKINELHLSDFVVTEL